MPGPDTMPPQSGRVRWRVLLAVGALGVSCVMTQLALMREFLCAFSGNELVLGVILGNWLLLTGLGTWLGRNSSRLKSPWRALVVAQILVALLPLAQVFLIRALRNVVFVRGAAVGITEAVVSSFVVWLPYCLVSGFFLTLACAILAAREGASSIGSVYVADGIGSIAGGALFGFVLVRYFDHFGLLCVPALMNLLVAAVVAAQDPFPLTPALDCENGRDGPPGRPRDEDPERAARPAVGPYLSKSEGERNAHDDSPGEKENPPPPVHQTKTPRLAAEQDQVLSFPKGRGAGKATLRVSLLLVCALTVGLLGLLFLVDVDALSTALQYPQQQIRFRANSPYGKLVVTESAGQFNFILNGLPVTSTHNLEQVEETVHYAMAQRPEARKVLLVGGGISGTARELLKYAVGEVTYVELDPLFIEAGRRFLPEALADRRIQVVNTDGRWFIKRTDQRFDVVIVDVPDPSTSQLNRFYTAEFFAEVKRVLTPEGVLSFSLGHYENFVSRELGRILASANATLNTAFAQVRMIPGGRVFFLASDGPLHDDIAGRLEQRQVPTRFVKRQYLEAMLMPDRLADLERATSQAAEVNKDFNPVLYYYHLVHWMSQFKLRFGLLEIALAVLMLAYLLRLRAVPLAIFASGFAASALEVVLLLGFQVLYGSLYQQMALLVTLFMAGLAAGAFLMNRLERRPGRRSLGTLAFALAGFAALLPLMLRGLGRLDSAGAFPLLLPACIPLLTLLLGVLVGLEFPLANAIEFQGTAVTASQIYTADFVGACLGALFASTLLIPLFGVTTTCLLTAALNVVGGTAVWFSKR